MENNFKTTDLDDKFANWESELDKLDSEEKIKNYQTEIQQAIQNLIDKKQKEENNNNGFSLSTKIAIGVGIILIMLVSCCLVIKRIKRRK